MKNKNEKKEALRLSAPKKALIIAERALWGAVCVLLALLILLTLWLAFDKYVLRSPVPSVFGYSTLTIETGSMNGTSVMVEGHEPSTVSIGDLILIKKTNDYKIGDVITFLHEGERVPTTHRIVGYTDSGFITKGDANNTKDTVPVSRDEVIGEVVGHYPRLGKLSSWVKAEGWMYIACALAIIAVGGFFVKLTDDGDSESEEETPSETGADGESEADESGATDNLKEDREG